MDYPKLALLVDGRWIDRTAAGSLPVANPADGTILGELPSAGAAELQAAAAAAQQAWVPGRPDA